MSAPPSSAEPSYMTVYKSFFPDKPTEKETPSTDDAAAKDDQQPPKLLRLPLLTMEVLIEEHKPSTEQKTFCDALGLAPKKFLRRRLSPLQNIAKKPENKIETIDTIAEETTTAQENKTETVDKVAEATTTARGQNEILKNDDCSHEENHQTTTAPPMPVKKDNKRAAKKKNRSPKTTETKSSKVPAHNDEIKIEEVVQEPKTSPVQQLPTAFTMRKVRTAYFQWRFIFAADLKRRIRHELAKIVAAQTPNDAAAKNPQTAQVSKNVSPANQKIGNASKCAVKKSAGRRKSRPNELRIVAALNAQAKAAKTQQRAVATIQHPPSANVGQRTNSHANIHRAIIAAIDTQRRMKNETIQSTASTSRRAISSSGQIQQRVQRRPEVVVFHLPMTVEAFNAQRKIKCQSRAVSQNVAPSTDAVQRSIAKSPHGKPATTANAQPKKGKRSLNSNEKCSLPPPPVAQQSSAPAPSRRVSQRKKFAIFLYRNIVRQRLKAKQASNDVPTEEKKKAASKETRLIVDKSQENPKSTTVQKKTKKSVEENKKLRKEKKKPAQRKIQTRSSTSSTSAKSVKDSNPPASDCEEEEEAFEDSGSEYKASSDSDASDKELPKKNTRGSKSRGDTKSTKKKPYRPVGARLVMPKEKKIDKDDEAVQRILKNYNPKMRRNVKCNKVMNAEEAAKREQNNLASRISRAKAKVRLEKLKHDTIEVNSRHRQLTERLEILKLRYAFLYGKLSPESEYRKNPLRFALVTKPRNEPTPGTSGLIEIVASKAVRGRRRGGAVAPPKKQSPPSTSKNVASTSKQQPTAEKQTKRKSRRGV